MLRFTVYHNDVSVKTYELDRQSISIGRLPENDISIASMSISRRHVKLELDAGNHYVLTDLNSLNGVFLNNKKVSRATLTNGDRLSLGKYSILFEDVRFEEDTQAIRATRLQQLSGNTTRPDTGRSSSTKAEKDDTATTQVPVLIETNKHVIYKLDKPMMSIGSSEKDDIFVEGFLIANAHVMIERDGDGTVLHANKLMGRFKINGRKTNKCALRHKDRIEIGTSTFRYMENG